MYKSRTDCHIHLFIVCVKQYYVFASIEFISKNISRVKYVFTNSVIDICTEIQFRLF